MMYLRPATIEDADNLFAWRNDPGTLASFRSTEPVPRIMHDRWMKFNVEQGYPEHRVLIADSGRVSVGVVRFDALKNDVMSFETSITVAPRYRGQGLAQTMLAEACSYMNEYALLAEIRRENYRSRKIFSQCGFNLCGTNGDFVEYRREPKA